MSTRAWALAFMVVVAASFLSTVLVDACMRHSWMYDLR